MRSLIPIATVLMIAAIPCDSPAQEKQASPDAVVVVHLGEFAESMSLAVAPEKGTKAAGPLADKVCDLIRGKGGVPKDQFVLKSLAFEPPFSIAVTVYEVPGVESENWIQKAKDGALIARGVLICLPVAEGEEVLPGVRSPYRLVADVNDLASPKKARGAVPPKGHATVEGDLTTGRFPWGKGGDAELAIKNGSSPIILAGDGAKDARGLKGQVRATGKLEFDERGRVRLVADKVEPVKK